MDRARGEPLAEGDGGGVEVGEGEGGWEDLGGEVAGACALALETLLPGVPGVGVVVETHDAPVPREDVRYAALSGKEALFDPRLQPWAWLGSPVIVRGGC